MAFTKLLSRSPLVVLASLVSLSSFAPAHAEARWDGLLTDGANFNWLAFQSETAPTNSLKQRGVETDFSAEEIFEPEFQQDTLRDKVRKSLSFDRNR